MQARFHLCSPRLESLFPPVLWKSHNQILLAFKVRFPERSHSFCYIPSLWSLTWGSEPWQQWENFGIIVLQFVSLPPVSMGFDFIVIARLLLSQCSLFFVFGCWISFLGGLQHCCVSGCSIVCCDLQVKGFSIVNKAEVYIFLEFPCFLYDPTDIGNLISGSFGFLKSSFYIWKFLTQVRWSLAWKILSIIYLHAKWVQLSVSLNILWNCPFWGLGWKQTFSSPVATAAFSKFADIFSAVP